MAEPLGGAAAAIRPRFAFDLWAYEDVSNNAAAILERVRNGTMPCDGAWPPEKVETFERWTTTRMSN